MRGFENTLKSEKKLRFGTFITTGWIQPLLGICNQQSKAVCLVLSHAGGSPPSARGGMVELHKHGNFLLLKGFPT